MKYLIIRGHYRDDIPNRIIKRGLTLEQAQEHCRNPETSSKTCKSDENIAYTEKHGHWFDGYDIDK